MLLFLLLSSLATGAVSFLVPGELPYGSVPVLSGSLLGGWALLRLDGRPPGALGFYWARGVVGEALAGLGLGILIAGAVVVGLVGMGLVRWVPEAGNAVEYLQEAGASLWRLAIPAAAEEALLRGYLLQAFAESWGGGWALWTTSLLFGILHLGNPNTSWIGLANILVAGVFLGVVYLRTASLWWATGVHLGWNWTHGFLADLPISGLEVVDAPLFEPVIRGADWLSGGPFGPEGSVVSTVILSVAALALWRGSWLRPGERAKEVRPLFLAREG